MRRKRKKRKKPKKKRIIEVKKITKKWEIWNEEEEIAKSEKDAKKMVFMFSVKRPVNRCPQRNYGTTLLI